MSVVSTARVGARVLLAALLAAVGLPLAIIAAAAPAHAAGLPPQTVTVTVDPDNTTPFTADGVDTVYIYAKITNTAGLAFADEAGVVEATASGDITFSPSSRRLGIYDAAQGIWRIRAKASKTAGTETITVTARNAATIGTPPSGSTSLVESPGPVSTVTVGLTPTHIPADGTSESTALVTLTDQYGNKVPGQTVLVGTNGDTTVPAASLTDNNNGTYTGKITASNTPGPETITVTGGGKTGNATLTEYGDPAQVTFALNPSTLVANGTNTSQATVTVLDAQGNGVANRTVVLSKEEGADSTVGSVTNNDNGTYTAVIVASTTDDVETYTASVVDTALVASADLTETPGAVHEVKLSVSPETLTADGVSTSTATIRVEDAFDNLVRNQVVALSQAVGNDLQLGEVTQQEDGTYQAIITSSITTGTNTVTATTGSKTGTATITEVPGAATGVGVTMTPSSLIANGTNTSVAKATVTDANGNRVKNATVTFTKAEGDDVVIGQTVTNNGDGTYQVSVQSSTTAGVNTITAKVGADGPTGSATLTETPGPATAVALVLDPASIVADGASTSLAKATVTDQFGNKVVNENVTFSKAVGSLIAFGPVSFNEADSTYRTTITSGTKSGVENITAKANNANKTTTQPLVLTPGPVTSVTVALNPTTLPANGTSTSQATVTVADANGNKITNEVVEVTAAGGPTLTATNNNNGTYTATVTANTTPGDRVVTAEATNSEKTGTATLNQFGAVDTITVVASPKTVPADGTTPGTLTATLKDSGGNPVTNATVGFGTSGNIFIGTTTNNGNGTYTAPFRASTTAGTETITANAGKTATTTIIEYGPASTVVLALDPATVTADGVATSTATATVKDVNGNPVLNENLSFTTNGDSKPAAAANQNDGTYTSVITSSTTAGAETITARATKANKSGTATLTEVAGPATVVTLALSPTSIPADGTSTSAATVTVKDAKGNPVKNETVVLTPSGDTVPANSGATTNNGDGTYTGSIKASTTSGLETITATALGTGAFTTAALTETPGAASAVTLTLSPSTIAADGVSTSTATAAVRDANGNLVPGPTVTITSQGGETDPEVGSVTNNGDGTHTAVITSSTTAGAETITATASGVATPATAVLTQAAGPVASIVVTLDPASIVADGVSSTEATATVRDANGNLVDNDSVAFAKDGVTVVASATNNGDGTYTAVIPSSTVAGPKQITATSEDSGQTGSATLQETAGALSTLSLALNPTTVVANGTATSVATASAADENGNPIKDEVVTILSSGDAGEAAVVNNGDGTYTSTITASTTAGAETITATATKAGKSTVATLTETPGPVNTVVVSLTPSSILADGATQSVAKATVKDANNNLVKDAVVAFSTNGDVVLGAVQNLGDGTYTSAITSSKTSGVETITASVAAAGKSGTAALTETAGPATSVTVSLAPATLPADGVSKSVATATVKDVNGNLVPNETVTFATSGDSKLGAVVNKGNGTYTSTITASKTAGQETITARATKAGKNASTKLTEVVSEQGYWLTAEDGGIFAFGAAPFHGSIGGTVLNEPVTGMAALPDQSGYWQVATDGGIFTFGDALFHGSMGGQPLNQPVVGMAPTKDGGGYWLVAADGGIFSFGNAKFRGSTGSLQLNQPITSMIADPDGDGYWFVASDGGVFAFNADFYGSLGGFELDAPIVGMAVMPDGKGYWMVDQWGGVYEFGSAAWYGDMFEAAGVDDVVGMSPTSTGKGYWLTTAGGEVFAFGDAKLLGSPAASGVQLVSPIGGVAGF